MALSSVGEQCGLCHYDIDKRFVIVIDAAADLSDCRAQRLWSFKAELMRGCKVAVTSSGLDGLPGFY
ncbi:hypothetical protein Aduo_000248 [Ancylostoma duodenale]